MVFLFTESSIKSLTLTDARCRLGKVQSNAEVNPSFFNIIFFVEFIHLVFFKQKFPRKNNPRIFVIRLR